MSQRKVIDYQQLFTESPVKNARSYTSNYCAETRPKNLRAFTVASLQGA